MQKIIALFACCGGLAACGGSTSQDAVSGSGSLSAETLAKQGADIRGTVEGLSDTTFSIGAVTVDFSQAAIDDTIQDQGGLQNGLFVEVESDQMQVNGTLLASSIEMDDAADLDENEMEIEGVITALSSAESFEVSGQQVATNAATLFERGTAADLAVGVRVEVEGDLDASNTLVAEKVSFRFEENIRIRGDLSSVDSGGGSVTVFGSPGITVQVPAEAELRDKRDDMESFSLADLAVGDEVRIRASLREGSLVASRLERRDPELRVRLQGPVGSISPDTSSLTILGITIQLSAATEFEGDDELPKTSGEFFSLLQSGSLAKATGTLQADGSILATELELEDEMEDAIELEIEDEPEDELDDEPADEPEDEMEDEIDMEDE